MGITFIRPEGQYTGVGTAQVWLEYLGEGFDEKRVLKYTKSD